MSNNKKKTDKVEAVEPEAVEPEAVEPEAVEAAVVEPVAEPVNTKPAEVEASWDVETWKSVSRLRIGVEPYAITGALSKKDKTIQYTEREIRALVEAYLNTPASRG